MTRDQIAVMAQRFKTMTKQEVFRECWPLVQNGELTPSQYAWCIKQGKAKSHPSVEPDAVSADREGYEGGGYVAPPASHVPEHSGDVVGDLIKAFGGRVV